VSVGDWVGIEGSEGEWAISEIEERANYIVRKSVNLSHESHIIASNLDRAILVATMKSPTTFPAFIDRFCLAAEIFHIPVAVVFNKVDLIDKDERTVLSDFMTTYSNIGYETIACSVITGEGLEQLSALLKDQVSLLSGHSGVGKSSLINAIDPHLNLRIGEVSAAHRTGQHTTTFAEMHKLTMGGYIVDTPGIRGFGMVDIEKEELAGYFPEMRELLPKCKFYNCLHVTEPGCAVKKALEDGYLSPTRYNSYLSIFNNDNEETYRT
jgi:ribosome biogenesis GTPase